MIIAVPRLWEMFQTLSDGLIVAVAIYLIQFDGLEAKLCFVVGIKKMRAEISFKMRVVSPFETVWSSNYESFCVGSKKYLTWRVIFDLLCGFHGTILEGFWGHLEVENRLGDSWGSCSRWSSIFQVRPRLFWRGLGIL